MTGTEKILNHIREEAAAQAASLRAEGEKEAAALLAEAEQSLQAAAEEAAAAAENLKKASAEKTRLSLAMEKRQAVLAAKGEVISEVLAEAKSRLLAQDVPSYFDFLCRLLEKQGAVGDGVLCLSAGDLQRMPADFGEKVAAIAAKKGGKLVISKEAASINGGFILNYRDTAENCSLDALFTSEEENLKDIVRQIVFSDSERA